MDVGRLCTLSYVLQILNVGSVTLSILITLFSSYKGIWAPFIWVLINLFQGVYVY